VFLDRVVTSTLAFEGQGRVVEYVGGFEDYLRQRAGLGQRAAEGGEAGEEGGEAPSRGEAQGDGADVRVRTARPRRLSYNEVRELEALPGRIAALEAEQTRLQDDIASPEFYKKPADEIHQTMARLEAVGPELDAALTRWMELEERQ
jgi:ATP-binding cassette subfamily F protein uup